MSLIDPDTGLETDVPLHANLLLEFLLNPEIQAVLVMRCRAEPMGITMNIRMLRHAAKVGIGNLNPVHCGCNVPHNKAFWRQYSEHVRTFLSECIEDGKCRRAIARQLARTRQAPFKTVLQEIRGIRAELIMRREMLRAGDRAGLILVEN